MSSSGQRWHRLEFTAVSRKKSNGLVAYGFVLFEDDTGNLIATGCGPVARYVSYNQACHTALLLGLQVALAHSATHVLLQCDSKPALKQALGSSRASSTEPSTSALAAARDILQQQLTSWRAEKLDRWSNGLAVIQAEFASELHEVLLRVAAAPPSKYVAVAGQLGLLLQVPISTRRWLEAADDFVAAAAELVAVRCGANRGDVLATMTDSGNITTALTSISSSTAPPPAAAAAGEAGSGDRQICFHMQRIFTPQEGAAYAAAAAKAAADAEANKAALKALATDCGSGAVELETSADHQQDVGGGCDVDQMAAGGGAAGSSNRRRRRRSSSSSSSHKLEMGRVVGRHRMSQRLLVVGLHPPPSGWPGQALQQQQQHVASDHVGSSSSSSSSSSSIHASSEGSSDSSAQQWQQQQQLLLQQDSFSSSSSSDSMTQSSVQSAAAGLTAPTLPAVAGTLSGPSQASATFLHHQQQQQQQQPCADFEMGDELIGYWLGRHRAGGAAAVGLGSARYQLPQVPSDTATHLLQFDGASRNNPGRGGYGYVIFDLTTGQIVSRGCMTLPYGLTAGRAEFEGLNAGLQAALAAGIRQLAVQGDSDLVLDAMMYRRGTASRHIIVPYQKACQLLSQFDHVDFQCVPRHQNSLADRLANISMDIDTAMYALLRRGVGDKDALRLMVKAAKINKKQEVLDLLLETFEFPVLLCVLLHRVMALTPEQLLHRLEAKAAHMGDPNPALVQEVRQLVNAGIPADIMQHIGAAIMDSRYSRIDMAKLRTEAALVRQKHPRLTGIMQQQQQQQQQHQSFGSVRHYSQSTTSAAAGSSPYPLLQSLQLLRGQHGGSSSSIVGPSSSGSSNSSCSSAISSSRLRGLALSLHMASCLPAVLISCNTVSSSTLVRLLKCMK